MTFSEKLPEAMTNLAEKKNTDEPLLLSSLEGGVARLTLNRPDKYNSLSEALIAEVQATLDHLHDEPALRCVVLAANGPAFCAGHDLKEMRANPSQDYYRELFANCSKMMQGIIKLPVPVIALVQGMATAAGCQLVATCDLAIASEKARFAVSGINLGLFCSTPSVALSRNLARKRAFEMLITGKFIDALTAADWGLVNEVVPPEELETACGAYLESILAKSPAAVRTGKTMFYEQISRGLAEAYDYAGDVMACNMMDGDAAEGIDAFLEKRTPRWGKE